MEERIILEHNLTMEEYNRIVELLGREPNIVELGIFSAMWSEHCSYKSSKLHLKKLPTSADYLIQGPGENAGIVDFGEDIAIVFKIESHNHPSFVEPFQGAATGVGGIIRDIFAMGARPIALMDSLRFGYLNKTKNKLLLEGVVSGIASYGNCMGIPTVGGEVFFEECYDFNPLVNVLCLGVVKKDRIFYARAKDDDNLLIYIGAETGRDGIHGANILASRIFEEEAESKRSTVQVADPFMEKKLLEACLELMKNKFIEAIQDMGAAGLTSSSSEMASRGGKGVEINLEKIPLREKGMTPYEIMLSESQERMLIIVKPEKLPQVYEICSKWDVLAKPIGRITSDKRLKVFSSEKLEADIPIEALTSKAPVYNRRGEEPYYLMEISVLSEAIKEPSNYNEVAIKLLSGENLSSKKWIYRQYDYMVRTNTICPPGNDAAVLRIKGTSKGIAITTDGNGRYCYIDPYKGALRAVAEACRNIVCVGAKPWAATNCLNFANPENPIIMWQFQKTIEGMSEAFSFFNIPITGGNVSFYNETSGKSIYPTPVIGIVGILEKLPPISIAFKEKGDIIYIVGEINGKLDASEYLRTFHNLIKGKIYIDLAKEKKLQDFILKAKEMNLIKSAHDVSEGGLFSSLMESAFANENLPGFKVDLDSNLRADEFLFSEMNSVIIISADKNDAFTLEQLAERMDIFIKRIGEVKDNGVAEIYFNDEKIIYMGIEEAYEKWSKALEEKLSIKEI